MIHKIKGVKRLLGGYPMLDPALVDALCDKPARATPGCGPTWKPTARIPSAAANRRRARRRAPARRHPPRSRATPPLPRKTHRRLDFRFLEERANLVFIGPPGVGKTHLAVGIGLKALEAGDKVLFTTALALVETLELAELRGELRKKIAGLLKFDLLIIDELGDLPMNRQGLYNLFQLINGLYEYRSVILTTNKDVTNWGEFFRDENVAVPIVDRLIHHSQLSHSGSFSPSPQPLFREWRGG